LPAIVRYATAAVALAFVFVHLRALPRSLEDIDSVNFALGVESFDVAAHQPHPPGYPVYILLGKTSTAAVAALAPGLDRDERAAVGLALWGVLAGALAAFTLVRFWNALGFPPHLAWIAMVLGVGSPIFWFTAARPLTDVIGLAAALAVQTLFFEGWRRWRDDHVLPRSWTWAAAAAGFIVGLRSQTMWLTGPLLGAVVAMIATRRRPRDALRLVGLAAAGALLWGIPLVVLTGGIDAYLASLGSQGAEDFQGAWMLAVRPSLRLFVEALDATFLVAWNAPALGVLVTVLALAGIARAARAAPTLLVALGLGYVPYVIFHIAFHETSEVRYALPLIVPMSGLAVFGLGWFGARAAAVGGGALAAAALVLAQPPLAAYAAAPSPVMQAFQQMRRDLPRGEHGPALLMHHQVWWGVRRLTDWYRPYWHLGPQPFPGDREWLTITSHWQSGQTQPVWLLADLARSDTRVFDPRATVQVGRYRWPESARRLIGGSRLTSLALWRLSRPGWMLGEGWSVTPEVAGMTFEDARNPHQHPAAAYIARRGEAQRVMIGGRYLAGSGTGLVIVSLDGREIDRSTVAPGGSLLRWIDLPAGSLDGTGPYATLHVRVVAEADSGSAPWIGLEQFDAATLDEPMFGFDAGWQELEQNATGLLWRWSSARGTLAGYTGGRDVTLVVAGENPLRYFDRAPVVTIWAGRRQLARFSPSSDFEERVRVPGGAFDGGRGEIHVDTDLTFVPGAAGGSPDQRQLGLRIYRLEVDR
jgi:hypothetical protein